MFMLVMQGYLYKVVRLHTDTSLEILDISSMGVKNLSNLSETYTLLIPSSYPDGESKQLARIFGAAGIELVTFRSDNYPTPTIRITDEKNLIGRELSGDDLGKFLSRVAIEEASKE